MEFDDILKLLGEFGTYQKILYLLLCIPGISCGIFMVISVFLMGIPDHRCALPGYPNDTFHVQNAYHEWLINNTIPGNTKKDDDHIYDTCNKFVNGTNMTETCDSWVYDKTVFHDTFVTKIDLVCGESLKTSHSQMIFFAGVLIGALGFGVLSDTIGRKKTLYISFVLLLVSSLSLAWAPEFISFCILRFLVGSACAGIFMTGFVLGMELVGPSKRVWAGVVIEYFFAIGLVLLAGIGYGVRDWHYIEIIVAAPTALFLFYWWIIPESPRWLMSMGREEEAEVILRKAAKVNKVSLPEKIFDDITLDDHVEAGKVWHLFYTRSMAVRTLVIFFNWMVVSMVYYGLSLNSGNLGGDYYLNFFLSGVVEFPAYTLCLLLLDRLGRKILHCSCMILGGIACMSTIFSVEYGGKDLHALTVTLAMIGKVGAAAGFAVIYVFSAELYPTVVRNAGMGASSCCARIGGMIAPYVVQAGIIVGGGFGKALPMVIFGGASIAAGVLALLLPETLGHNLPETIEDGENFGKQKTSLADVELYDKKGFEKGGDSLKATMSSENGKVYTVENGLENKSYENGNGTAATRL